MRSPCWFFLGFIIKSEDVPVLEEKGQVEYVIHRYSFVVDVLLPNSCCAAPAVFTFCPYPLLFPPSSAFPIFWLETLTWQTKIPGCQVVWLRSMQFNLLYHSNFRMASQLRVSCWNCSMEFASLRSRVPLLPQREIIQKIYPRAKGTCG